MQLKRSAFLVKLATRIIEKFKQHPVVIFWVYTLLAVLFKSAILVSIINFTDGWTYNIWQAFLVIPTYYVYIAFLLIVLSFSFLLKARHCLWFLISFNILYSLLMIFDLWYFRAVGTFLSVHVLKQYANLDNLTSGIFSMMSKADLILIFDIPLVLLIAVLNKKFHRKAARHILVCAVVLLTSVGSLAYAHYQFDLSAESGKKQYLFLMCWTPTQTITDLSPIGYHLYDAYNYFSECEQLVLKEEEKAEIEAWFADKKEVLPDTKYKSMFKGKNLIFIQVESLENFYLQHELDGMEITPNLNRLLNHSLYFSDIYEQVNVGTTSDAELMANTSVYPLRVGTTYFRYPDNTYNSMPKLLEKLGYSTLAIHPDYKAYWNWQHAMEAIGYPRCMDSTYFKQDEKIGLGLSDESFFRQVEPVILQQKEPFFVFMITLTNHGPFELPDKYKELSLDPKFNGTKIGASFHTVHYTDAQIGSFLDKMDEDGLLENTVVVIYGDHNAVHKYYTDEVNEIKPAEEWWLHNNHHVPFLIYQKHLQGEEIKTKGGHIDILPTVAYLMGVEDQAYAHTAMGRNLLKTAKDFAVLVDGQFVGNSISATEEIKAIHGLEIADKIIRSSYFGKRK